MKKNITQLNMELRKYGLMKFIYGLKESVYAPVYALFLAEVGGLTDGQIGLINAVFFLLVAFIDPVTGHLGDKYGHRRIFLLGFLFWTLASGWYGLSFTFGAFVIAEILAAVGYSLQSDALEADLRNKFGNREVRTKLRHVTAMTRFLTIPGSIFGAWLGTTLGYEFPWFVSAGIGLVGLFVGVIIYDLFSKFGKRQSQVELSRTKVAESISLKDTFQFLANHNQIRWIVLIGAITNYAFMAFNMLWSLILVDELGEWIVYFVFTYFLFMELGKVLGSRYEPNKYSIMISLILIAISIIFGISLGGVWILVGFLAHELFRGVLYDLLDTKFNDIVRDGERAAANSTFGSMRMVGGFLGLITLGVADIIGREELWILNSIILILLAIILIMWKE